MTTFTTGLLSGVPIVAALNGLSPETLSVIFGILAGMALALAAIYVYVLANQRDGYHVYCKPSSPSRPRRKRSARRYPTNWPLTGVYALAGGAA